jgi:GTP-binding nuclear protein Ran
MSQQRRETKKIIVCGSSGSGKTTFLKRIRTGDFEQKYQPTMGAEVTPFDVKRAIFNIWDTAGSKKFKGLGDGYYSGSNGALVFYEHGNRKSYIKMKKYFKSIREKCGDIPIVVCCNKVDKKLEENQVAIFRKPQDENVSFAKISARSNYNFLVPFTILLRKIFNDENISDDWY